MNLAASIVRTCSWVLLGLWVAVVLLNWAMTTPQSAIHQCVSASQAAALVIAGYAAVRAATKIADEVEKFVQRLP